MPSKGKKKGGASLSADTADSLAADPDTAAKVAASEAAFAELMKEEDAAKDAAKQLAAKKASKVARKAKERAAAANLASEVATSAVDPPEAPAAVEVPPASAPAEALTLSDLSSSSWQPAKPSKPARANVPSSSGAVGPSHGCDASSDGQSVGHSSSRTGGGRSRGERSDRQIKGGSSKDNSAHRPPTKRVKGKDRPDYPDWVRFVYTPEQENNSVEPKGRLLKLLNPGSDKVAINHFIYSDFHKVACRAIKYLYHQPEIDLSQGWDEENSSWDEQTAVHFAAQCSHKCLKELVECWGTKAVVKLAASCDAKGYNALHRAAYANNRGCVKFLLEGEVGAEFLLASQDFCESLLSKEVHFRPSTYVDAFTLKVSTDRQVERENLRHNNALDAEQRQRVRNLPVRVKVCNNISTRRTALSIAAEQHYSGVVNILLQAGADPNQYVEGPVRTTLCSYGLGRCAMGTDCTFAHNESDLGMPRPDSKAVVPYVLAIRSFRNKAMDAARARMASAPAPADEAAAPATDRGGNFNFDNLMQQVPKDLKDTLELLKEGTKPEHMQRAVSVLLKEVGADPAASPLTMLWAANLLDVEPKDDNLFAARLATRVWPQLVAAEADAASMAGTSAAGAPAVTPTPTTETLWLRLQAKPDIALSAAFYGDTLATLAIRAHDLKIGPRKQTTCTLLTELLRRFPGCASASAPVALDTRLEGDLSPSFNALNVAVEHFNYAAVDALLTLDPPASFLTLDGVESCSAVGMAIAQLKGIPEAMPHFSVLRALGDIIDAFATRAEASSMPHPEDWVDIRAPIIATVEELKTRWTKDKDRTLVIAPWERLLSLWPESAADDGEEPPAILPVASTPGALPTVTPPTAALPAPATPAVVATTMAAASLSQPAPAQPPQPAQTKEKSGVLSETELTSQHAIYNSQSTDAPPTQDLESRRSSEPRRASFLASLTATDTAAPPPPPLGGLSQPLPLSRCSSVDESATPTPSRGTSCTGGASDEHSEITKRLKQSGFGLTTRPRNLKRFQATEASFLFKAIWKNETVVVKQLHPGAVVSAEEVAEMRRKRYWQEFKFHRSLKHPYIVELLECYWNDGADEGAGAEGVWNDSLHLVFPYFPLGSLGDVLRSFRFADPEDGKHVRPEHESYAFYYNRRGAVHTCSPQFIHSTLLQISKALDFLHYRDTGFSHIIHRDLKTENVLVEAHPNGTYVAKLTDFGLARHFDRMTRTAGLKSTMQISAPEMHSSATPKYDLKVDVYAFGHMIWEVLSLQKPFSNLKTANELDQLIKDWNTAKKRLEDAEEDFQKDCEEARSGDDQVPGEAALLIKFLTRQHEKNRETLRAKFEEAGNKARPSPIVPPLPHHLREQQLVQQLVTVMQGCLDFDPKVRPNIKDIKDMLEDWQSNAPELHSAPEHSVALETLGNLVKQRYSFRTGNAHSHFMDTLRKNDGLLAAYGAERTYLLPRLADETNGPRAVAYEAAAKACQSTLAVPWAQATEPDWACLSGMLKCVRNLVEHCQDDQNPYLHAIGWDKARLRYELGNRFAVLAVKLAVEVQKAHAEQGENDDVQGGMSSNAWLAVKESIMTLRRNGRGGILL